MLLTEQQLHEIRQIVEDHHNAFIINAVGSDAVDPKVVQRLKDKGLVNIKVNGIEDSYLYGQILAMMDDPKFANMSYAEFKRYVQKNPIPLNAIERRAVQFAKIRAGQYAKGLGNLVGATVGSAGIEADAAQRQKLRDTIKTKTAENIAKRESLQKLKSELGWATRDWARDWRRIANTEKQNAMQRGVADHYAKRYGGDVRVAKRPMPDACKHCKRLHIGPDGQPRIFKLSDLEANGTNVGRRAADWKAVVGTVHPHCQCQMVRVPTGWGFDEEGSLVPGGELGVQYESAEDLQLAMLQEMDLQKAFKLTGYTQFQGIPIAIENDVASVRKWQDGLGGEGQTIMRHAYGYIPRTTGDDEDEVDVFLGPDPRAQQAYIIHQRDVHTDLYDEAKVMLGFSNERDAVEAYRANYERPNFIITCTPMDMDAFKRWVSSTEALPGEMMKAEPSGIRFVIPLSDEELAKSQAGKLASEAAASKTTFKAAKGPVSGTASNYQVGTKPRAPAPPVEGLKENLEKIQTDPEGVKAVRRDKETYHFIEPQRKVFPIELPDDYKSDAIESKQTEERRKDQERFMLQNRGATRNTIDPKDSSNELQKAKNVTPIGGMTPGGYKKVAKGVYIDPEKAAATVGLFDFAKQHGGKVVDHFSDKNLKVLKIPKSLTETLQTFKTQHGLSAEVGVGGKYAMLNVTIDEIKSLEKHTPKKKPAKEKPTGEKPTKPVSGITVPSTKGERQGKITLVPESSLEPPKTAPWVKQRGRAVKVMIDGKLAQGTVQGADSKGNAVIKVGSKEHRGIPWTDVEGVEAKVDYKPAYAGLPADSFVRPDVRQQKLLDKAMAFNVIGSHKATEYTDWLRNKGQEAYLVGGIVRDLYAGTKPESKMTDGEVLEKMKDVDIVSTAQPQIGKLMMQKVGSDVPQGGMTNDSSKWGVVIAGHKGDSVGLDFSSMAARDNIHTPIMNWDHSIEEDISRRDFTCNSLFYDPHNKVVIDPTGNGIADAQNMVLRLAPKPEDAIKNSSLHLRFWKFRARGYSAEAETLKYMRKHAEKYFADGDSYPHHLVSSVYKMVGAKGGDIKKNLADFKAAMEADGCLDLYDKYIGNKTVTVQGKDGKVKTVTIEQAILTYDSAKKKKGK